MKGSGSLLGYGAMWLLLKWKYDIPTARLVKGWILISELSDLSCNSLYMYRDVVMKALYEIDSEDTADRQERRLCRRKYHNKVIMFYSLACTHSFYQTLLACRVQTMCGIWMGTVWWAETVWICHTWVPYMGALMGMFSNFKASIKYIFHHQSLWSCSYSRRVMWLNVGPSNSNPALIAGYYLDRVKTIGGWYVLKFNTFYLWYT